MEKDQENKLTMYEGVLTLLGQNSDKTSTVPAFAEGIEEFGGLVTQLRATSVHRDQATIGKACAKAEAKEELITVLMPVAAAIGSYARRQKNVELQAKAKVTVSDLQRMRDTEVVTKAKAIIGLATENQAGIEHYGATSDVVRDLQAKTDAYSAALGARESSMSERVGARTSLLGLFDQIDALLKEDLDLLIEQMRRTFPQFYNEYLAARVIKDIGIRHEPAPQPPA